jgi:hypothetical protein
MSEQKCDDTRLKYLHYSTTRYDFNSYNCTTVKKNLETNNGLAASARRECLSHMGGSYQGDISYGSVRRVPVLTAGVCVEGESDIHYQEEACCPG